MDPRFEINLPMPPSVNSLYRNVRGKGRVKTRRYCTWLNSAGWHIKDQRPKPLKGKVIIKAVLQVPEGFKKKQADASNFLKAIEDLLVEHELIEDDSWQIVRQVDAEWSLHRGRQCWVSVYSAADGRFQFVPRA